VYETIVAWNIATSQGCSLLDSKLSDKITKLNRTTDIIWQGCAAC